MFHIRKRFYIFISITLILFSYWLFRKDDLILSLFLVFLLFIGFSFYYTLNSIKDIQVIRTSKFNYLQVGSFFMERILISNISDYSKWWLVFIDQSSLLAEANSRVITNLKKSSTIGFLSTVVLKKRGFYNLGPSIIKAGDPLGLFEMHKVIENKKSIYVFPQIAAIRQFPLLSGDETGGENLKLHTTKTTPQAAGIREYQPGDPLNRVHWPMTIKRDKLFVKEFDEDTQSKVIFFLDAHRDIYAREELLTPRAIEKAYLSFSQKKLYELPRDGFEYAISVCASLVNFYIRMNMAVGMVAFSNKLHIHQPDKGERQLVKILETLAVIKDEGNLPLSNIIEKQRGLIQRGNGIICISPKLDSPLTSSLMTLRRKGLKPVMIRINNASFSRNEKKDNGQMTNVKGFGIINISFGDDLEKALTAPIRLL